MSGTCEKCHQMLFFNGSDTRCTNPECSRRPMSQRDAHAAGYAEALVDVEMWLRGMRRTSAAFFVDQLANALKSGNWRGLK